ncbi:LuxR C-terminal-related transcriptional regulator [Streptomyces sp. NPDC051684]|uniref:LuxR C-terminal-related transcriptional regulator n=1 Tax=Streptomyces sp. NPDC051684 TaxID=3365670 RepID=UPI0037A684D6
MTTQVTLPGPAALCVPRPGVLHRLDAARGPVVLVTAPAGYGKTVAVAEWARAELARGRRVAWCALDAGDREPARLWARVAAAVAAGGAAPAPAADEAAELADVVDLLSEAGAGGGEPLLVVDGLLPGHPGPLRSALAGLARWLPPGVRLVVTARGEFPELPGSVLTAGVRTRVDAGTLRLTEDEARRVAAAAHPACPPGVVRALTARASGWVSGLRLALEAWADGTPVEEVGGASPALLRYVREEIIDLLGGPELAVLVLSAAAPRLDPVAAEQLVGPQAAGSARRLMDTGVLPDGGRSVHPLLREALHAAGHTLRATSDARGLVPRLCSLLEEQGEIAAAVDCAVAAGATGDAARLLERHSDWLLRTGRTEQAHRWLLALGTRHGGPAGRHELSPALASELAWNIALRGSPDEAEAWAARLGADAPLLVRMRAAAIRAFAARTVGDLERTLELADEARRLAVLAAEEGHAEDAVGERISLGVQRAVALTLLGRAEEAEDATREALGLLPESEHPAGAIRLHGIRAQLAARAGRLREAEADYETGERLADRHGLSDFAGRAELLLARGLVHHERNEAEQAEAALRGALRLCHGAAWPQTLARISLDLALLLHGQGRAREAERHFEAAAGANPHRSHDPALARAVAVGRALALLRSGDAAAAHPWFTEVASSSAAPSASGEEAALAGYAAEAGWTRPVAEAAGSDPHRAPRHHVRALLARARAADDPVPALRRAAALAARHGLVRSVLDDAKDLHDRLAEAAARCADTPEGPHLHRFARAAAEELARDVPASLASLTVQERAVAALLTQGASNERIAAGLFVSVNTVKTHLRHIYRKLGVTCRAEAAERLGRPQVTREITPAG